MTHTNLGHEMLTIVKSALGDGPELTTEQQNLLPILLDPENDPSTAAQSQQDMLDELECLTGDDVHDASVVAGILGEHHRRRTGNLGEFVLDLVCDTTGVVDSYNVLSATGSAGAWLAVSADAKYLYTQRYGLKGLRGALQLAETLQADYNRIPRRPDVSEVLNWAADEVIDLNPGDEHLRDVINLVVNTTLHRLEHPEANLVGAITACYDEDPEVVLSWINDSDN